MKLRTLLHILRIEGLTPFTGCAVLIGFAVTLWETGFYEAEWSLFLIAAFAAFLVHVDAHIWNDIMDLDIDRREKSRETGRDRPLVAGWATVGGLQNDVIDPHDPRGDPYRIPYRLQDMDAAPVSPWIFFRLRV